MVVVLPTLAFLALCLVVVPVIQLMLRPNAGVLDMLLAVGVASLALLVGPWPVLSAHLRPLLAVLLGLTVVVSGVRRRAARSSTRPGGTITRTSVKRLGVVILVTLNVLAVKGLFPSDPTVDLGFPLRQGDYSVLQGGNSPLTNTFHRHRQGSRHALDIVKLNRWGGRARGLAPTALSRYEIFGERLYSPCNGTVLEDRDDLADNAPGAIDRAARWGNYLLLRCSEADVLLAHLMNGSLVVETGDVVAAGELIAQVGNSGLTNEPHLHLAAYSAAADLPNRPRCITFEGRFLSVNSSVRMRR